MSIIPGRARALASRRLRAVTGAVIAAMAVLAVAAAPAAQAQEAPTWGILDVQAWQESESVDTSLWVTGSLTPVPSNATITIKIWLPGLSETVLETRSSRTGDFGERLALPPGASGSARIRIQVSGATYQRAPIYFPTMVLRVAVDNPVATPAAISPGGDASQYRFIFADQAGRPAQWDSCRPITYLVGTSGMPAGLLPDVHEAMTRLARATSMDFVYGGETSLAASIDASTLPDRTILIAWSDPSLIPQLAGPALGLAGAYPVPSQDGRLRMSTGIVILDRTDPTSPGFGKGVTSGQVLMHELGHVMNLDHVIEPMQLMYPYLTPTSPSDFQAGDLAGLAQARSQGCLA